MKAILLRHLNSVMSLISTPFYPAVKKKTFWSFDLSGGWTKNVTGKHLLRLFDVVPPAAGQAYSNSKRANRDPQEHTHPYRQAARWVQKQDVQLQRLTSCLLVGERRSCPLSCGAELEVLLAKNKLSNHLKKQVQTKNSQKQSKHFYLHLWYTYFMIRFLEKKTLNTHLFAGGFGVLYSMAKHKPPRAHSHSSPPGGQTSSERRRFHEVEMRQKTHGRGRGWSYFYPCWQSTRTRRTREFFLPTYWFNIEGLPGWLDHVTGVTVPFRTVHNHKSCLYGYSKVLDLQ